MINIVIVSIKENSVLIMNELRMWIVLVKRAERAPKDGFWESSCSIFR
jgi:hypothetical protein